jgi:cytidine deaminase
MIGRTVVFAPTSELVSSSIVAPTTQQMKVTKSLEEVGRALWRELFLSIETEEQLSEWESKIPCGTCKQFYSNWKTNNPPTFPLQPRWKYELKSAVNEKLGHQNISFEEACQQWNWNND